MSDNQGGGTMCPGCNTMVDPTWELGASSCPACGTVLDTANIVSDITFFENSRGQHSVLGQLVSADKGYFSSSHRESRANTIASIKNIFSEIGEKLLIIERSIHDAALRIYKLALDQQLTKGRERYLTAAACLYLACRRFKKPLMLIDFSVAIQQNVFSIGKCAQYIKMKLVVPLPMIEPNIFIQRFARHLEFGEDYHRVCEAANVIVESMKRNWMVTGRRPAGICACAVLVASRIYGYKRTALEIVSIARISPTTLRKRLREFLKTDFAKVTLREFEETHLQGNKNASSKSKATDPPCFHSQNHHIEVDTPFINEFITKYPVLDFIVKHDTNTVDTSTNHTIRLEHEADVDPPENEKPNIPSFAFYEFPPVPEYVNNAEETAEDDELDVEDIQSIYLVEDEKELETRRMLWNHEFGNFYQAQLRKRKTRELEREDKNKRDIKRKRVSNVSFSEAAARMLRKHVSDGVVQSLNLGPHESYDEFAIHDDNGMHYEDDEPEKEEPPTQPKKSYGSLSALVSKSQSIQSDENFLDDIISNS